MKLKLFSFIFLGIIIFSAGIKYVESKTDSKYSPINKIKLSNEAKLAKKFLEQKNYKVISYSIKTTSKYVLTKKRLEDKYEAHKWKLQLVSADKYIGKTIYNERFIVKNHPLDNWSSGPNKSLGKTYADVIVVNRSAIGGISAPHTKEALVGLPYSLDGKTFEELKK